MLEDCVPPSKCTFVALLKACARLKDAERGRDLHGEIARRGLERDSCVGNILVDMYAKCGFLAKAREAFDNLAVRDVVSWTALISAYAKQGLGEEALDCFEVMKLESVSPNALTFVCSLKACGCVGAIDKGQEIHADVARNGLERGLIVGNALVDMYVKCGSLAKARDLFDKLPIRDVVSWTALIAGYAEHMLGDEALNCFELMQLEALSPDALTFVCSLKACSIVGAINRGREIHIAIVRKGLEGDLFVGNTLVDMYAKGGLLAQAQEVFDRLPVRDVVSWNALIAGYAEHGLGDEALNYFEKMQVEGVFPNALTFVCSLKASCSIGAIDKGQDIHDEIAKIGLERDPFIGNALVDMYATCGLLVKAREVFDRLSVRDEVSWNAIMAGYAQLGESEIVFNMLERMRQGTKPTGITLLSILTVCSHTGLVDEGRKYFEAMSTEYGITPTIEHHNCMVDLLGRAGQVEEAIAMVKRMPFHPNLVAWHTLLGACRKWGNVALGKLAFKHAVQLDDTDASSYIMMSNIYADAEVHEDENHVQAMRVKEHVWKEQEESWWTDIGGIVHTYLMGLQDLPKAEIYMQS